MSLINMATKSLDLNSIKQPEVIAEDELLKYLLAFEPLLASKQIKYEWSFTDYHKVNAPADGFRSIIEYTLNKTLNNPYSPEYILVFTHSFEDEMVIEFELGHGLEDAQEHYFLQSDIDILNQIYSHYGWQLEYEANHVGSLLTWTIKKYEALDKPLKQSRKKLKTSHLGVPKSPANVAQLASALIIENFNAPASQLSIILEKSYAVERVTPTNIHTEIESTDEFDLIVIKSNAKTINRDLVALGEKLPHSQAPIFAIVENLSIELKIDLLESGCTDVIAFPFSTSSLLESVNSNTSAKLSLRKDSKTGAVDYSKNTTAQTNKTEEANLMLIKQLVADNYHDIEFNEDRAAIIIGLPLNSLDHMLNHHIYHNLRQFITSYRLANAYEMLASGQDVKEVGLACGFASFAEFESAYEAKYAQRP